MSSTASATSASTVRPSFDTSAKPPSTTILCVPLPACTVRMPGRNVVTIGAWSARTPKSPSVPGTSTCCTSPENRSFCGDTNSKRKLAIVSLSPALADGEAHTKSDHAANHGQDRDVFALLNRLFDGSYHVESGLRQVIIFAFAESLEAFDGVLQIDQLAGGTREHFRDVERL